MVSSLSFPAESAERGMAGARPTVGTEVEEQRESCWERRFVASVAQVVSRVGDVPRRSQHPHVIPFGTAFHWRAAD